MLWGGRLTPAPACVNMFEFIAFKLRDEPVIWMDDLSPRLNIVVGLLVRLPPVLYQVGDHQRYRSRNTRQTVHHYVCRLQLLVDEVGGPVEEGRKIEGLVVSCWNIQVLRHQLARVVEGDPLGCGQNSSDGVFCMTGCVL